MSADDEHDPAAETPPLGQRPDPDLLGSFDAFRARRAEERAQAEPFPDVYGHHRYDQDFVPPPVSAAPMAESGYDVGQEAGYAQFPLREYPAVQGAARRPWRSVAVFGGVVVLVVGLGAGVYAALRPSDHARSASSPLASASAPASPGSKVAKGDGRVVTARLTVTAVSADSFTATVRGETVVVQLTSQTRFGTAARPFTRPQLVEGAIVYARLRREADGTVVATVIASSSASGAPTTAPSDTADASGAAA